MSIEIHIRVRESDWDLEHELAELIAEKIESIIPNSVNISTFVIPVEDPGNEMPPLIKETEGHGTFHDLSKAESKVRELKIRHI
jgi:hypothetical protein